GRCPPAGRIRAAGQAATLIPLGRGAADRVEQAGQAGAEAAAARSGAAVARGGGDQVLARVEGQGTRDGQCLVSECVEFRVVAVQGEDGGAGLARVADPLEQRNGGGAL